MQNASTRNLTIRTNLAHYNVASSSEGKKTSFDLSSSVRDNKQLNKRTFISF